MTSCDERQSTHLCHGQFSGSCVSVDVNVVDLRTPLAFSRFAVGFVLFGLAVSLATIPEKFHFVHRLVWREA